MIAIYPGAACGDPRPNAHDPYGAEETQTRFVYPVVNKRRINDNAYVLPISFRIALRPLSDNSLHSSGLLPLT